MDDALLTAASQGDLAEIQRLLCDNQPNEETIQDLLVAAAGNFDFSIEPRLRIIQFILENHPPDQVPERALLKATFSGSIPLFSAFFTKYDPSKIVNTHLERHGTPLVVACTFGRSAAFVEFLLRSGADPNYLGEEEDCVMRPLVAVAAMWRGDSAEAEAAVDMLLRYGATGAEGALEMARSRGNEAVERRLSKSDQTETITSRKVSEPSS